MGDVMFAELLETYRRGLITTLDRGGIDPFEHARPVLDRGDLNVINLECVLSDRSRLHKPFSEILIAPERSIRFLSGNRINVVTTANNHALDHGIDALKRSIELLESHGIAVMGYRPGTCFQSTPVIVPVRGRRIGFLGYNISNFPSEDRRRVVDRIKGALAEARGSVDTLVVSMHWGEEYSHIPPPHVIRFGREILDAGCDILHGHHAHQIQGVLRDGNRIFAPSLGNFVFDQMIHSNRITAILSVSIEGDAPDFEFLPYYLNRRFQPEPAPRYAVHIERLNRYLAESYAPGSEDRYAEIIRARVRQGHRRNRIRMRLKMLGRFPIYLPYRREIQAYRASRKKLFSVVDCEDSLAREMDLSQTR